MTTRKVVVFGDSNVRILRKYLLGDEEIIEQGDLRCISYPGAVTDDLQGKLSGATSKENTKLYLHIGINDLVKRKPGEIVSSLRRLVTECRSVDHISPAVCTIPPRTDHGDAERGHMVNNMIECMCNEEGVEFTDLRPAWNTCEKGLLLNDGVHYSRIGAKQTCKWLAHSISSFLRYQMHLHHLNSDTSLQLGTNTIHSVFTTRYPDTYKVEDVKAIFLNLQPVGVKMFPSSEHRDSFSFVSFKDEETKQSAIRIYNRSKVGTYSLSVATPNISVPTGPSISRENEAKPTKAQALSSPPPLQLDFESLGVSSDSPALWKNEANPAKAQAFRSPPPLEDDFESLNIRPQDIVQRNSVGVSVGPQTSWQNEAKSTKAGAFPSPPPLEVDWESSAGWGADIAQLSSGNVPAGRSTSLENEVKPAQALSSPPPLQLDFESLGVSGGSSTSWKNEAKPAKAGAFPSPPPLERDWESLAQWAPDIKQLRSGSVNEAKPAKAQAFRSPSPLELGFESLNIQPPDIVQRSPGSVSAGTPTSWANETKPIKAQALRSPPPLEIDYESLNMQSPDIVQCSPAHPTSRKYDAKPAKARVFGSSLLQRDLESLIQRPPDLVRRSSAEDST